MKKFFKELISDNNNINEQAFVGVISFFAMVFVLLVDVVTGMLSKELKELELNGMLRKNTFSVLINLRVIYKILQN